MPVRILIADDDSTIRMLFRDCSKPSLTGRCAARPWNGMEAVEQAARVAPDVAILDLSMPVMNGLTRRAKFLTQILSYPCFLSVFRKYRTSWSRQPERSASAEQLPRVAVAKWSEALRRFCRTSRISNEFGKSER
jgi:chemotaxis response regulator CheB